MRKLLKEISMLWIIYIIFCGELTLKTALVGMTVAIGAWRLVFFIVKKENYEIYFAIKIKELLGYIIYLLGNIVVCGMRVFVWVYKEELTKRTFTYESELDKDILLNILAGSITLTPGTITVSRKENELLIMQVYPKTRKQTIDDIKKMEQRIKQLY